MLRWESIEPNHISIRILKPEMVGMHVDSYGALIEEREEYGSSSFAYSHWSEGVADFYGILENMSDFE